MKCAFNAQLLRSTNYLTIQPGYGINQSAGIKGQFPSLPFNERSQLTYMYYCFLCSTLTHRVVEDS